MPPLLACNLARAKNYLILSFLFPQLPSMVVDLARAIPWREEFCHNPTAMAKAKHKGSATDLMFVVLRRCSGSLTFCEAQVREIEASGVKSLLFDI